MILGANKCPQKNIPKFVSKLPMQTLMRPSIPLPTSGSMSDRNSELLSSRKSGPPGSSYTVKKSKAVDLKESYEITGSFEDKMIRNELESMKMKVKEMEKVSGFTLSNIFRAFFPYCLTNHI